MKKSRNIFIDWWSNHGRVLGIPSGRSAVIPWLSGGIAPSNCVAAYHAVGATGLLDSYINRAHPGTNNIPTPSTNKPEFYTSLGWKSIGSLSSRLITDIIHNTVTQDWSVSICFQGAQVSRYIFGLQSSVSNNTFNIVPSLSSKVSYSSGYSKVVAVSPGITSGVLGIAGTKAYRNGAEDGTMATGGHANSNEPLWILTANINGGIQSYGDVIVSSVYLYNTVLSPAQMSALAVAQAALAAASYPFYGKYFAVCGDSKTIGTNGDWATSLKRQIMWTDNVEVGKLGYALAGITTAQMATAIAGQLASQPATPEPIGCLYDLGANDIVSMPTAPTEATWKANTQTILNAFHAKWPSMPIYLCKIWLGDGSATYEPNIATFNGWVTDMIAANPTFCHAGHDETVWARGADDGVTMMSATDAPTPHVHYNAAGNVECYNQWKAILGY